MALRTQAEHIQKAKRTGCKFWSESMPPTIGNCELESDAEFEVNKHSVPYPSAAQVSRRNQGPSSFRSDVETNWSTSTTSVPCLKTIQFAELCYTHTWQAAIKTSKTSRPIQPAPIGKHVQNREDKDPAIRGLERLGRELRELKWSSKRC
jgi:hypothetical protein